MAVNQQQLDYLSAMGIPVWISRDLAVPDLPLAQTYEVDLSAIDSIDKGQLIPAKQQLHVATIAPTRAVPTKKGLQTADALIKDLQQAPVKHIAELAASLDESTEVAEPVVANFEGVNWVELQRAVSHCTACDLHEKRQNTVFGGGSQQPSLMVVGDIPRIEDEQHNQPFFGETGELLSNMLKHLDVSADTVYFTNLLKCRTPLDGAPQPNQAASCLSYLKQQIKLLQPSLVLLLGRSTAQQVLGQTVPMVKMRRKHHQLKDLNCNVVVSYHPAYLLKQPRLKVLAWQDLQFIKQALHQNG